MPDLAQDFPPVSTADWEAAIAKDLKGADYQKKLIWRTEEGIGVRPYYRRDDLPPMARLTPGHWEIAQHAEPSADAIRADLLHEAGAHAVQELAFALTQGADRLAATEPPPAEIEFVFATGPHYFIEIAKFRAARLVWAQVEAAFGLTCRMRLDARTPARNKSIYDRHTNLLRVTTEAMSAILGGCDRLTIVPFGFDPHLALNVQRLLQEESHLDAFADAAAGSYYIEALTDALAREAWKLFQQGGVTDAVEQTRAARVKAMSSRRRVLVGVNNYPNLTEKEPTDVPDPLPPGRLAEPFEDIRRQTTEYARAHGRYPKILLLKRGDAKMKSARANFCLNFLGCAGFDIAESESLEPADLIVLCSADPEYLPFAQEICPQVKVPVWVAGNPKDQIESLKAAGIQNFVHIQSDALETLTAALRSIQ